MLPIGRARGGKLLSLPVQSPKQINASRVPLTRMIRRRGLRSVFHYQNFMTTRTGRSGSGGSQWSCR